MVTSAGLEVQGLGGCEGTALSQALKRSRSGPREIGENGGQTRNSMCKGPGLEGGMETIEQTLLSIWSPAAQRSCKQMSRFLRTSLGHP